MTLRAADTRQMTLEQAVKAYVTDKSHISVGGVAPTCLYFKRHIIGNRYMDFDIDISKAVETLYPKEPELQMLREKTDPERLILD